MELESKISEKIKDDKTEQSLRGLMSNQETTVSGIRLAVLQQFLSETFPKIESAKDQELVMVIGNSGAGKSTTINYQLGTKFEKKRNKRGVIYASPVNEVYAVIGEDLTSMTSVPQTFKSASGLVFCDFPGFMDTGNKERQICISINTQTAINLAKSIKAVMVVIDFGEFNTARAASFRQLAGTIGKLLVDAEKISSSIFFIITKANKQVTRQNILETINSLTNEYNSKVSMLKDYFHAFYYASGQLLSNKNPSSNEEKEYSGKNDELLEYTAILKFLKLIHQNTENIILCNVFDEGESKKIITDKLLASNNIDKNQFNFSKYDDTRINFNHLVFKIVQEGTDVIGKKIKLPERIQQYKIKLSEAQTSIKFYEQQIIVLNSNTDTKQSEQTENIKLLKQRIEEIKKQAIQIKSEITQLNQETKNLDDELQQLNSETRELYWQDKVHEERHPLGFLGRTTKEFSYHDVSYLDVDVQLGSIDRSTFSIQIDNSALGQFKGIYKSNFYENGIASVSVFVKRKDKPDNQKRIENIKKELETKKERNKILEKDSGIFVKEINTLQASIMLFQQTGQEYESNRKKQIGEMESGKRDLLEKIELLKLNIEKSSKLLEETEETFKLKRALYEIIAKIATNIDFDSSLIDEFVLQYTRLSSKYHLDEDEVPEEYKCSITKEPMDDPVIARCGHSFDRVSIMKWIGEKHEKACPCCRKMIHEMDLTSNLDLKKLIATWRKENTDKEQISSFVSNPAVMTNFFQQSPIPNYPSKILNNLVRKVESLGIEIDRLQREQKKINEQIAAVTQLQTLIKSAQTAIIENDMLSITLKNRGDKNQAEKLLKIIKVIDIVNIANEEKKEDIEENKIYLKAEDYKTLMGENSFENLSKNKATESVTKQQDNNNDSQDKNNNSLTMLN